VTEGARFVILFQLDFFAAASTLRRWFRSLDGSQPQAHLQELIERISGQRRRMLESAAQSLSLFYAAESEINRIVAMEAPFGR
jgi:hypothetical protein